MAELFSNLIKMQTMSKIYGNCVEVMIPYPEAVVKTEEVSDYYVMYDAQNPNISEEDSYTREGYCSF